MTVQDVQTEILPVQGTNGLKVHRLAWQKIRQGKPGFGLCLMGGGPKPPEAFRWMAERAGHGHGVVLDVRDHPDELSNPESTTLSLAATMGFRRLSTLVVDGREKADATVVARFLDEADAIFLPGGDQTRYWNTWHDTEVQRVINRRLATRSVVLGGSSAGMHVMGGIVHTPGPGNSVGSEEALNDPYLEADPVAGRAGITFQQRLFEVPGLDDTLTDTHWSERNRMGRSIAFLARILQDGLRPCEAASAVTCDEGVAVCLDRRGRTRVFQQGSGSAFRITATCPPQVCRRGVPLSWLNSGGAIRVQRIVGAPDSQREILWLNVHEGHLSPVASTVR